MAKISPFAALRPKPQYAEEVATLPYDVVSVVEARAYRDQPHHFFHVTRSEIDLAEGTDVHSRAVYERAKENLDCMVRDGVMRQDDEPCYYIYELTMNGRAQTGLICASSINDYFTGVIKKHEFTRPEKEKDRTDHIRTTRAQTGIVFLAYRDHEGIQQIIEEWKSKHKPAYDFVAEDGVGHRVWVMDEYGKVSVITHLFDTEVPATYIADGHHRAASAARVCTEWREAGHAITGEEAFNFFLTAIFPASQLAILDYNRVVTDLAGMSGEEFLAALREDFDVAPAPASGPYRPQGPHEIGAYVSGAWHVLTAKSGTFSDDPIGVLDVSILQNNVLSKHLGIHDPRVDKRVDFVGGIRGLEALQARVDNGEAAAAFALHPVTIEQLFAIADSGEVMPPKSTWFEPKLRDGLVVYLI
jgi:uncharacterized protein (DUF1015 family)